MSDPASTSRRGRSSRLVKYLRRGVWALLGGIVAGALYFAAAAVGARITTAAIPARPGEATVPVYFVSNGVHIDVWVPARHAAMDWTAWLPPEVLGLPARAPSHVSFGWGSRDFYLNTPTWDDLTWGTAVKAVLWPTSTAVRVSSYPGKPSSGPHVHRVDVPERHYHRLVEYLKRSFGVDAAGRPRMIDHPGYDEVDRFFEGDGSYHAFRTCNVWTNGAVQSTGIATGVWTPFESGVRRHLPVNEGRASHH